MKPKSNPFLRATLLSTIMICSAASQSARAGTLYWDSNSTTTGAGTTPTGTWGTDSFWSTDSLGLLPTGAYVSASDVVFSAGTDAGTYTVTVASGSNQNANSLTFEEGNTTLSGTDTPYITLSGAGGNVTVNSGATAVIGNTTSLTLAGSVGLTKLGAGTLTLNPYAADSSTPVNFSGDVRVYAGTLALDFAYMAGNPVNMIAATNSLTLGGGTLSLVGKTGGSTTTSQAFASTSLNSGASTITLNQNSGSSTTLDLKAITRTNFGTLNFSTAPAATGTIAITTNSNTNSLLGTWVTVGNGAGTSLSTGETWATVSSGKIIVATLAQKGQSATDWVAGANIYTESAQTLSGSREINTYRGRTGGVALAGFNLTLNGLLASGNTPISGAGNVIIGSSGELVIMGPGSPSISSNIINGTGTGNNLTYGGSGTLTLSGANTYSGGTYINSGTLVAANAGALPGYATAGKVVLGGGTLVANVGLGNNGWSQTQVNDLRTGVSNSASLGFNITGGNLDYDTGGSNRTLASITRGAGGTLRLIQSAANQVTVTSALSGQNQNGILPWAILNTNGTIDLAVGGAASSAITALSTYTTDGTTWGSTVNARPTSTPTALAAAQTANALVLDNGVNFSVNGTAGTLTLASTGLLVQSGGTSTYTMRNVGSALAFTDGVIDTEGTLILTGVVSSDALSYTTLTKTGAGTLQLGTSSGTGRQMGWGKTINLNQGLLEYYADRTGGTGIFAYNQAGILNFNGGDFTIHSNGSIADGGSNSYSPSFNTDATITIDKVSSAGSGITVSLGQKAGSTVNIKGVALTVAGGTLVNGGTAGLTLGNTTNATTMTLLGTPTLNVTNPTNGGSTLLTLNGNISESGGSFGLIKTGNGALTLAGTSTYTGATTISAGTLSAGNIVVSSNASNLGNATSSVTLGSAGAQGILSYTGNTAAYTRGFTIGGAGGGRLNVTSSAQTLTVQTGDITGSGLFTVGGAGNTSIASNLTHTGGLTKADAGTLTLSGNNSYAGTTTISAGTLQSTKAGALANSVSVAVNNAGSVLAVNYGGASDYSATEVATLLGKTTFGATTTAFVFDTTNATGSVTYGNVLSQAAGLIKSGTGTLVLNQTNTYTGKTTISAGTLSLGHATDTIANTGAIDITAGTLDFGANSDTVGIITMTGGTLAGGAGTLTSTRINVNSTASAQMTGGNIKSGGTDRGLVVGNGNTATFTISGGIFTSSFGGANVDLLGNGASGNGTLLINGGNYINAGTLSLGNTSGNGTFTISSGSATINTLKYDTGVSANGIVKLDGGTLTVSTITVTSGATKEFNFNGGQFIAGAALPAFSGLTLNVKDGGAKIDTAGFSFGITDALVRFTGATTDSLTKSGGGTLTLSGTNSYGGGSSVSAGILQFAKTAALPTSGSYSATDTGTLAVNAGGTNEFTNGTSGAGTIGGFFSGASFASGTAFGIDTTGATSGLTYVGNFSGTGVGVTKLGTNTLILTGTSNTYTGVTTISAGTLQIGDGTDVGSIATSSGITNNGALVYNVGAGTRSYGNAISGTGTLTQNSSGGTLTLSGTNLYTGITTLTTGTLVAGNVQAFGTNATSAALTLNGGTLDLATDTTVNAYNTKVGGTVTIASDKATASSAGITHTLGTLSIGANTLSITQGANATGSTAGVTFGNVTQTGASVFDVAANTTLTLGSLQTTARNITKQNSGTLILGAAANTARVSSVNTLSLGTLVLGGTVGTTDALGTAPNTLVLNGGTLDLATDASVLAHNTTVGGTVTIASDKATGSSAGITHTLGTLGIGANQLNVTAGSNVTSGTAGLTFSTTTLSSSGAVFDTATGTNLTLGALVGAYNFTKQNSGQLTLNTASTRTGGATTLSTGTLKLGAVAGLGTTGATLTLNGGTLDLATDATVNAYNTTVGGTVTISSNKATGSSAGITHTLGTLGIGANQLNVTAGSNVTSGTAGLTFGGTTLSGAAVFDTATGTNLTLGALTGNYDFTKQGAGTMTLTAASTRSSGVTTLSAGTLSIAASGASTAQTALGTTATTLQLNGGILDLSLNGAWRECLQHRGGRRCDRQSEQIQLQCRRNKHPGHAEYGRIHTLHHEGHKQFRNYHSGIKVWNHDLDCRPGSVRCGTNALLTLGTTSGSGIGLTKQGSGSMTVGTYTGGTVTINGGTFTSNAGSDGFNPSTKSVVINNGGKFNGGNNITNNAVIFTINNGGTFDLVNNSDAIGGITGAGTLTNSGGTLTTLVLDMPSSQTFDGSITGNINLSLRGLETTLGTAQSLTLSNTGNSFAGSVAIGASSSSKGDMSLVLGTAASSPIPPWSPSTAAPRPPAPVPTSASWT